MNHGTTMKIAQYFHTALADAGGDLWGCRWTYKFNVTDNVTGLNRSYYVNKISC